MENVIDLQKLWKLFRKGWLLIFILAILFGGLSFFVSKFVLNKEYASTVSLLVNRVDNNNNIGAQYGAQQADVQLISTYKNIITQPIILNNVAKNLSTNQKIIVSPAKEPEYGRNRFGEKIILKEGKSAVYRYQPAKYKIDASTLAKSISITSDVNSQVFNITVKNKNSQEAADIANEIAKVFKNKIVKLMSVKNVSIVSKALVNNKPISPNMKLITLLGFVFGAIIGFMILVVREITDRSVKSIDFYTNDLNINDLGTLFMVEKVPTYREYIQENLDKKIMNDKKMHRRRV
ncbi:capsular biosynthesis protein [Periweissella fabaria]|uniref:Capsular polysaccharide biosynthesis protein CpsC n=1 Tax=Periweissella fabaria TaxID=546157 RepID=A0ABM8Z6N0_9LACO|nr:Wzz/FepE/Etk N-terminal domain-containing protein [Periweissella fabaria]MCM0596589.1 capsular biosynthesis protein [Periweissella fabaria]CAH0416486.1 Capsular polysaccharide type 8 biosynthesis protein cap8A [Periweissella fabaria]